MIDLIQSSKAISFTAGEPSANLIPLDQLREAFSNMFNCDKSTFGYYHDPAGLVELREWIAHWMKEDGLLSNGYDWQNLILTIGSQEGLNLFTEAVLDPGDLVVTENPSYPEALLTFQKEGARIQTIPLDEYGPLPAALEYLAKTERVKVFYTIPCFQNPSGVVTSLNRRKEILSIAKRFNFVILEDDPYRHLWYDFAPPSSYLSLDENDGRVIYLGSLSKIIAPDIRCGWMVFPNWLSNTLKRLRVAQSLNLPTILHLGLMQFIFEINFENHLSHLREAYHIKRNAMVQGLKKHIPEKTFRFNIPSGGFFIWGEISGLNKPNDFARFAVQEEGIGILAGNIFSTSPNTSLKNNIRLSFAKVSPQEADEGCARLAKAIERYQQM